MSPQEPPLPAGLYALIDDDPRWPHPPRRQLEAALRGGARTLQLRLKHLCDREALALCEWAVARAHEAGAQLFVNDRFDLADLAGADGVHLGRDDVPPERLPADLRGRLKVGLSTHTLSQVRASRTRPVDYIAFGPIYATSTKRSEHEPQGVAALAKAVVEAGRPVVAIGGITLDRVPEIRDSGVYAFAVISELAQADDPVRRARQLAERFAPLGEG